MKGLEILIDEEKESDSEKSSETQFMANWESFIKVNF